MSKPIDKDRLAKIGQYILEGLTESEAAIMSDASIEELQSLKEKNEDVRNFIDKSKVQFKYSHIHEIQTKKSDKASQWLLERLRPEDFATGRSKITNNINVIATIIKQIQQDDTIQLVARNRQDRLEEGGESNIDNRLKPGLIEILQ